MASLSSLQHCFASLAMAVDYSNAPQRNMRVREIIFPVRGNIFYGLSPAGKVHRYLPEKIRSNWLDFRKFDVHSLPDGSPFSGELSAFRPFNKEFGENPYLGRLIAATLIGEIDGKAG